MGVSIFYYFLARGLITPENRNRLADHGLLTSLLVLWTRSEYRWVRLMNAITAICQYGGCVVMSLFVKRTFKTTTEPSSQLVAARHGDSTVSSCTVCKGRLFRQFQYRPLTGPDNTLNFNQYW